ncbi:MAG TPA: PLP-dependent aminotransferase family protein [Nevskiales bacterium]|nr:PLP-dependent aminotransferase family protein [Nevskiales bacterium]
MKPRVDDVMWQRLFSRYSHAHTTLQQRIRETLVAAILDGHLRPDTALPSCRELARHLGVARSTVVLAYQHLVDEGFLIARERSGYYINREILIGRVHHDPDLHPTLADQPAWSERLRIHPSAQRNIVKPRDWKRHPYPFIYGQLDPELFPIAEWRECCRQALSVAEIRAWATDSIDRDDSLLLEQIQTRLLPRRGVFATAEEILITLGAQHALYLLAQLLIGPGDTLGMEEPGYPDARNIFALCTDRLRPIPVDDDGLVVDERLSGCAYVYVTPSHQSPTTVTMPLARREALLARAIRDDFVLIEDDYESEINFVGEPCPALKSLDTANRVIYVGSLSKTLAPGLRLGFMVGPSDLIREARALRRLMLRHPPANNERAVALFLAMGYHDALLRHLGAAYKVRWEAMGAALNRHLPDSARMPSFGGTAYWVRGPAALDARVLQAAAYERGIIIEAGDINFMASDPPRNFFRLGFSSIPTERIEPGIRLLAELIYRLA